jgi:hypothetical protein
MAMRQTIAMSASMSAYSTIVAPHSSSSRALRGERRS